MLPNRSVPDVAEKREEWDRKAAELSKDHLDHFVFVDESGVNTNLVRLYCRSLGGERVVDAVPVNTPTWTTIIAGITTSGPLACAAWQGGTTKVRLADWVKDTLIPALRLEDILIWDNLSAHHSKEVLSLLKEAGVEVLFIPPYSPDKDPIELMWSKMKGILRKLRIRVAEELPAAVQKILAHDITAKDCVGWFKKDGYVVPAAA